MGGRYPGSTVSDYHGSVSLQRDLCLIAITVWVNAEDLFSVSKNQHFRFKRNRFSPTYSCEFFIAASKSDLKWWSETLIVESAYWYDCLHRSQIIGVNGCGYCGQIAVVQDSP